VRGGQGLDVPGRILDLLDLQRVDGQSELLHLVARGGPGLLGQPLAVADHLLDRQAAHDRAQVSGQDVVHPAVHLALLVQEPPGGVGDRHPVVAHLEDHHALDVHRDALLGDAVHGQVASFRSSDSLRTAWTTGMTRVPRPVTIRKPIPLVDALGAVACARDQERLVRLGHPPHDPEQDDQDDDEACDAPRKN